MYIFKPHLRPISIFVLIYFTVFTTIAIQRTNYEFMLYEAQMALLMGLIVWMDIRVQFSKTVLWMLSLWGLLHLAGGLIPIPDNIADMDDADPADTLQVLYNMRLSPYLPRYDQCVHAFGFGTSALACKEALQAHLGKPVLMSAPMAGTVFLMALGLGPINELVEFAAVMLIPNTNVGGYVNTGWDLVSNSVGAALAILYLKFKPA